jgi:4-amino-4-deoxy-L-arabinose transferase-like glycosyltransferase
MPLLILPIIWILTAVGRNATRKLKFVSEPTVLERNLIGYAIGLGLLAYGLLALGLAGLLYPAAGLGWLVLMAALGGCRHRAMFREARERMATCFHPPAHIWGMIAAIVAFGAVALIGDFCPPTLFLNGPKSDTLPGLGYTEWDSLSYHLADPKLFLAAHRIYYIPWEHHSNFAFTAEMWYTLGLMAGSVPLAKLFHLTCAIGASLAIYAIGARHLGSKVGALAAALFASLPLVFWEAGTAYVDLAATFFVTLTLMALVNGIAEKDTRWIGLAALMMGLTLSAKATAVATLVLFAIAVWIWRNKSLGENLGKSLLGAVKWGLAAIAVGAPWFLKSIAYTGNPIFPFYYKIFGGKYWSAENAAAYDAANSHFGMGRQALDLLLTPFNLTMYPVPGHSPLTYLFLTKGMGDKPFNDFQSELIALSPLLLAVLFIPAFRKGQTPFLIKALSAFAAISLVFWFATTQYLRYLLPLVPVLCLIAAWVVVQMREERTITGRALTAMTVLSFAFSAFVGVRLASAQAPVAFGQVSKDDYITAGFAPYPAMQYINTQLPANAKVVFYGNPFGYYSEKPYLWGEAGHSTYIPYSTFQSKDDLLRWYESQGITHVLVNPRFFGLAAGPGWTGWVYDLTAGSSQPVFQDHGVYVFALPHSSTVGSKS